MSNPWLIAPRGKMQYGPPVFALRDGRRRALILLTLEAVAVSNPDRAAAFLS